MSILLTFSQGSRIYPKEEDKRLSRTTVVDDLKKTVFQVQKADVYIWTANDYDNMQLDMKSHSCLRSFDIWLLLEEEELVFFDSVAPDILIILQGRPQAQEW